MLCAGARPYRCKSAVEGDSYRVLIFGGIVDAQTFLAGEGSSTQQTPTTADRDNEAANDWIRLWRNSYGPEQDSKRKDVIERLISKPYSEREAIFRSLGLFERSGETKKSVEEKLAKVEERLNSVRLNEKIDVARALIEKLHASSAHRSNEVAHDEKTALVLTSLKELMSHLTSSQDRLNVAKELTSRLDSSKSNKAKEDALKTLVGSFSPQDQELLFDQMPIKYRGLDKSMKKAKENLDNMKQKGLFTFEGYQRILNKLPSYYRTGNQVGDNFENQQMDVRLHGEDSASLGLEDRPNSAN